MLFNRFYQPDIDLATLTPKSDLQLSAPYEIRQALLWISLLAGRVDASLAATTGVEIHVEVVKYLLAGADVVMTASALLRHGPGHIATLRDGLADWMAGRGFDSVAAMRGRLAADAAGDHRAAASRPVCRDAARLCGGRRLSLGRGRLGTMGAPMIFRQLFDPTSSTYTYLIASRHGGEALIIDPVLERVDRYVKLLDELDLRLIKAIDTHVHADHISGLSELRDRTRCITVMGEQSGVDVVSMRVGDGDRVEVEGVEPRIDLHPRPHRRLVFVP